VKSTENTDFNKGYNLMDDCSQEKHVPPRQIAWLQKYLNSLDFCLLTL